VVADDSTVRPPAPDRPPVLHRVLTGIVVLAALLTALGVALLWPPQLVEPGPQQPLVPGRVLSVERLEDAATPFPGESPLGATGLLRLTVEILDGDARHGRKLRMSASRHTCRPGARKSSFACVSAARSALTCCHARTKGAASQLALHPR
jgi:hypothetical protein